MESLAVEPRLRRARGRPIRQHETFSGSLLEQLRRARAQRSTIQWPSPKYASDPEAFCRDILGFEPWSRQLQIMQAVLDHDRIAVVSGQKTGKTRIVAGLAIWAYCSFGRIQVLLMAAKADQIDKVIWREIRLLLLDSGRCVECKKKDPYGPRPCPHSALIDGDLAEVSRTGFKAKDGRIIYGLSARDVEAVAGVSGFNNIWIIDEASKLPDPMYEAVRGNTAGGGKIIMISQGTRRQGIFFDAFHSRSDHYHTITIPSTDTPNYREGRLVVPGLATRQFIEELADEYGVTSEIYRIRVLGEFPSTSSGGRAISEDVINEAKNRHNHVSPEGLLHIGLDPAGPGGDGDETAWCVRRGQKILELKTQRGLDDDGHVRKALELVDLYRRRGEIVALKIDAEGLGSTVYGLLKAKEEQDHLLRVVKVRASEKLKKTTNQKYERLRDLLVSSLERWLREDLGGIPSDSRLEKELLAPAWEETTTGVLRLTPKKEIRKLIGRSPDRMDALALAVWNPAWLRDELEQPPTRRNESLPPSTQQHHYDVFQHRGREHDPFRGRR